MLIARFAQSVDDCHGGLLRTEYILSSRNNTFLEFLLGFLTRDQIFSGLTFINFYQPQGGRTGDQRKNDD
jgi:hypothetical protein